MRFLFPLLALAFAFPAAAIDFKAVWPSHATPANALAGYEVELSTNGGAFIKVSEVPGTVLESPVFPLPAGTTRVTVRVRAVGNSFASAPFGPYATSVERAVPVLSDLSAPGQPSVIIILPVQ